MNWSPRKKQPKPDSGGAKGGTRRTSPRPKCVSSRPENNKRNQQGNGAGAKTQTTTSKVTTGKALPTYCTSTPESGANDPTSTAVKSRLRY